MDDSRGPPSARDSRSWSRRSIPVTRTGPDDAQLRRPDVGSAAVGDQPTVATPTRKACGGVLACRHRGRNWQDQSPIVTKYAELRLRIDRGVGRGSYRIVATGPAGEALGRFRLPVSDIELENFVLKVGSTRRGRRRIDSPEMDLAKTFGTKLFGALFEGDVREL